MTEHTTPEGTSVFQDLFTPEEATNLQIRAKLMDELSAILQERFVKQADAAEALNVSQARISDLYTGKIQKFTIDMLINFFPALVRV